MMSVGIKDATGRESQMFMILLRTFVVGLILVTGIVQAVEKPTVLVMGATGRQGGAVVDELLSPWLCRARNDP